MSTVREQIIAAALLKLNTATPVGVPTTLRTRSTSPAESTSSISLIPLEDPSEPIGGDSGPLLRRRLRLRFELVARATSSLRPDAAVDPMYDWLVLCLGGETFGGLAHFVLEGDSSWEYDAGEYAVCKLTVDFGISYQHLRGNASSRS